MVKEHCTMFDAVCRATARTCQGASGREGFEAEIFLRDLPLLFLLTIPYTSTILFIECFIFLYDLLCSTSRLILPAWISVRHYLTLFASSWFRSAFSPLGFVTRLSITVLLSAYLFNDRDDGRVTVPVFTVVEDMCALLH